MNIAERIQKLRKAKGISQEELADVVGVSRQAVSKWESEQSLPDIDKIIALCEYFNVSTDYLLLGEKSWTGEEPHIPLNPLTLVAFTTAMNFLGLIVAVITWNQWQTPLCLGVGLILMVFGCMVFGMGCAGLKQGEKQTALYHFLRINIWVVVFMLFSALYNMILGGLAAPYPIFFFSPGPMALFLVLYFGVCGVVVWKTRCLKK